MKFLLTAVNAKYIHSNPAVYSLRACAGEELGKYTELAEYTINQRMQDILADIYKRKPDAVGFSCYIWNWSMVQELITELPKLLPGTDIWLGGPEVSYDADKIVKQYPQLTGIMVGEGEAVFRELLEIYAGQAGAKGSAGYGSRTALFAKCAGLCLPTGYTAPRALTDMNTIPFLYENLEPFENRIIYYESSRGCPYSCSYCLSSVDKSVRFRDIGIVKKELQFFLDNRVKQVKFVDRTFNCNHEHAMAVWQYLYEHDNGVTNFHFEISADILREEEISLLNRFRPGLAQLEIGVQSVNPDTIRAIERVMNVERLEKTVAAIHRGKNIHQHLDLIAGLPFEDYESFGRSFDRVYAMKPQQLQLGFLKVLKGSRMQERAEEYGIRYLDRPPYEVLCTKWLSYGEVLRLKQIEELVELFYNSSQFVNTLSFLEKAFETPFAMFEAMAEYFGSRAEALNSPARVRRYWMLLEFAEKRDGLNADIYRELLTLDMYLREKLKSRPEFARDLRDHREKIRSFYRQEEEKREFLPDYAGYDWKRLEKMTHLEPFYYDVWDSGRLQQQKERHGPRYLLFDYRRRSPLTCGAAVRTVEIE